MPKKERLDVSLFSMPKRKDLIFPFFQCQKKGNIVQAEVQWFENEELYLIGLESCISSTVGVLGLCGASSEVSSGEVRSLWFEVGQCYNLAG